MSVRPCPARPALPLQSKKAAEEKGDEEEEEDEYEAEGEGE